MANASLTISIPSVYSEALTSESKFVAIEHSMLRTRIPESVLAVALTETLSAYGKINVLLGFDESLRFCLDNWMDQSRTRPRKRLTFDGFKCLRFENSDLWLGNLEEGRNDVPLAKISNLFVVNPADVRHDVFKTLRAKTVGKILVAGEFDARDSWFYEFAREDGTELFRYPASITVGRYRDQRTDYETAKVQFDDTTYRRRYLLEDIEERNEMLPFDQFASERLRIRSDKTSVFLSKEQQEIAAKQDGTPVVPFIVSPMQRIYLQRKARAIAEGHKPRFLLLKYRRGGFTTLEQGQSYQLVVTKPRSSVATLAHTADSTSRIFGMVHLMHEQDPRAELLDGKATGGSLKFRHKHSKFFIGTAGGQAFGRGDTLNRVHGSEVAFWCPGPKQFSKVTNLVAGLTEAASNGEVVLESTPNGVEWFAATYKEAKAGQNNWTPIFLAWFEDPANVAEPGTYNSEEIQETLIEEEKELIAKHHLSIAQIAWRRMKRKDTKVLFPQEYPEDDVSCFLTSGTSYFDVQRVLSLAKKCSEFTYRQIPKGYIVQLKAPEKGVQYVAGCDTSEGIKGCDPNGVGIMRKDTGEQVAWIHGWFSPVDLAMRCISLCRHYNNALLGIERNNHGHAVLQKVVDLGYGRSHLQGGSLFYYADGRSGWSTDSTTRPIMLNDLADALIERDKGWHDKDFLDECMTFKLQDDGKFAADPGAHDDRVMYWAIAEQMRKVKLVKPGVHSL